MNAKEEFLRFTGGLSKIICAQIDYFHTDWDDDSKSIQKSFSLKVAHTPEELEEFLKKLDFDYDNGFGTQELFGRIWFENDFWAERRDYDGSEWWELYKCPPIPSSLF